MSTTTVTENRALAEEHFSRVNDRDLDVIDDLCADDFAVEVARLGTDESVVGREGLKAIYEEYFAAFPDIRYDVDEILVDGDRVAVFTPARGTQEGEFRGVAPTGNEIEVGDAGLVPHRGREDRRSATASRRVRPLRTVRGHSGRLTRTGASGSDPKSDRCSPIPGAGRGHARQPTTRTLNRNRRL